MCYGFLNYVDTVSCSSKVVQRIHTGHRMIVLLAVFLCYILGKAIHMALTQAAKGALAVASQGTLQCALILFYKLTITFSAT